MATELLAVSDAQDRYGVGKSALNARIRHCRIEPIRSGTRTFLTKEHVEILDALQRHLEEGQGLATFHSPIAEVLEEESSSSIVTQPPKEVPVRIELPNLRPETSRSRIEELRELLTFLEDCADRGWMLPTSELEGVLGTIPRGTGWVRFGFRFDAHGWHGRETAWKIHKPAPAQTPNPIE